MEEAYIIHNVPTLTELSLTGLFIKGITAEISAAVKSPINKLSLERITFGYPDSLEHLIRPIVYALEDLRISNVSLTDLCGLLSCAFTSWVGLKRLELPAYYSTFEALPVIRSLVVDVRKNIMIGVYPHQNEQNLDRMRALFQLCRKLKFETALSMDLLSLTEKIARCSPVLPLPKVFKFRKQLDEEEMKDFRKAYILLTGSKDRPTLVDPPEFFDSYFPDDPQPWEEEVSWF